MPGTTEVPLDKTEAVNRYYWLLDSEVLNGCDFGRFSFSFFLLFAYSACWQNNDVYCIGSQSKWTLSCHMPPVVMIFHTDTCAHNHLAVFDGDPTFENWYLLEARRFFWHPSNIFEALWVMGIYYLSSKLFMYTVAYECANITDSDMHMQWLGWALKST